MTASQEQVNSMIRQAVEYEKARSEQRKRIMFEVSAEYRRLKKAINDAIQKRS